MVKIDQTTLFYALLILALWLLFFQKPKKEKYCGACGALAA